MMAGDTKNKIKVDSQKEWAKIKFSEFIEEYRDGVGWIVTGAIALVIAWITTSIAGSQITPEDKLSSLQGLAWLIARLINLVNEHDHEMFGVAFGLLGLGFVFAFIGRTARKVWGIYRPGIERLIDEMKKSLIDEIRTSKLPLVISGAEDTEARKMLINMIARGYGDHCMRENSLPRDILRRFESFFAAKKPYASDHSRVITITRDEHGLKHWNELTTYSVRCTSIEESLEPPVADAFDGVDCFEIRYQSASLVDAASFDTTQYSLDICWDGNSIFNFASMIKKIGDVWKSSDDCCTVEMKGNLLKVNYLKSVKVRKASTQVTVTEKSIITQDDNVISLQYPLPCLRASIVIILPVEMMFVETNFNTYGTPLKDEQTWAVENHPSQTLSAHSSRWVPPGQCCSVTYRDIPKAVAATSQINVVPAGSRAQSESDNFLKVPPP